MTDREVAPLLVARDLTVLRGRREVCRGIGMSVARGECQGIVGPNGSGKTTLLLGLRGQLPCRGDLRLDGCSPHAMGRAWVARRAAAVPQRMEFAAPFTVEEMVLLGRSPHRRPWEEFRPEDRRAARSALERLGILPLAGARVTELSGGERRRVFLARTLAQDTPLVFFDEPTAGLDPPAQWQVASLIGELCERDRRAVVVVMHDLRLAAALCHRVTALHDGAQLAEGTPAEVLVPSLLGRLFAAPFAEFRSARGESVFLPEPKGK